MLYYCNHKCQTHAKCPDYMLCISTRMFSRSDGEGLNIVVVAIAALVSH